MISNKAYFVKQGKIESIEGLYLEALEVMEDIILNAESSSPGISRNFESYQSIVLVDFNFDGTTKFKTTCDKGLNKKDKEVISLWLQGHSREKYLGSFYRLNLNKYILIFKLFKFEDKKVIIGYLLKNSLSVKVNLLEVRQKYITEFIENER